MRTKQSQASKLNYGPIPQNQVTQFRLEYWKLRGQNELESLHAKIGIKVFTLLKLYKELVIERGMGYEKIANVVELS